MELKYLNTFLAVAKELNFSKSAEKLNYAQSSISSHIQALENELGVSLFERLGKRVNLTEEGKRLQQLAERIIALVEETREVFSENKIPSGVLKIGAHESQCAYRLPPVLREYRKLYPSVQLVFSPLVSDRNLQELLGQGILDAAFMLDTPAAAVQNNLTLEALVEEKILILSHPGHRLSGYTEVMPSDLQEETILVTEQGCAYRNIFEQALMSSGVRSVTKIEFSSIESIKQCVIAGLGIAALPEMTVKKELSQGLISILPWQGPSFPLVTQLAWHKDKRMTPALQSFIEITRKTLSVKPGIL